MVAHNARHHPRPRAHRAAASAAALALAAWVVLSASAAVAQPSAAPRPDAVPIAQVFRAAACYGNLDYACVVNLLGAFPRWYPVTRPGRLPAAMEDVHLPVALEVARLLGLSYLALGRADDAAEVFRWGFDIYPSFDIAGPDVPPPFLRAFYRVRAERVAPGVAARIAARSSARASALGRRTSATHTASRVRAKPPKIDPNTPTPLRLAWAPSLDTRWVALIGDDGRVYHDAPSLGLGLTTYIGDHGWGARIDGAFSAHSVRLDDRRVPSEDTLLMTHIALEGLRAYTLGPDWLAGELGLGAGASALGITRLMDRIAPNAHAAARLHISPAAFTRVSIQTRLRALWADTLLNPALIPEVGLSASASF